MKRTTYIEAQLRRDGLPALEATLNAWLRSVGRASLDPEYLAVPHYPDEGSVCVTIPIPSSLSYEDESLAAALSRASLAGLVSLSLLVVQQTIKPNPFRLMDKYGAYWHASCAACTGPFTGFKRQLVCYACEAPADMPQEHRDALSNHHFSSLRSKP